MSKQNFPAFYHYPSWEISKTLDDIFVEIYQATEIAQSLRKVGASR